MTADQIDTRTSRVWMGDDGVFRAVYKPQVRETLSDAKENVAAATKIIGNRKACLCIDMSQMMSISREARSYYAGEEPAKYSIAQALIVNSPLSKVIGNFFLGLNKPLFPTKLFNNEEEALVWLKGQMP